MANIWVRPKEMSYSTYISSNRLPEASFQRFTGQAHNLTLSCVIESTTNASFRNSE